MCYSLKINTFQQLKAHLAFLLECMTTVRNNVSISCLRKLEMKIACVTSDTIDRKKK